MVVTARWGTHACGSQSHVTRDMWNAGIAMPSSSTKAPRTVSQIKLRPLTRAEVDATATLWHGGWRDGHLGIVPDQLVQFRDLGTFRKRLELDLDACFITGPIGAPDGFLRLKDDEIDQFYIAASARGTGLAGALMGATEDLLRKRGVKRAWLYCSVGNDRAARFYEKCGFDHAMTFAAEVETLGAQVMVDVMRFEKDL